MKKFIGYDYNDAGELVEAHAYTITPEELDTIEDAICYYSHHTVEAIAEKYPQFVVEDFNKILAILANITNQEV